jgi:hypothetical protein
MTDPTSRNIANGDAAVCITGSKGKVYGKLFGTDKNKSRDFFHITGWKASQVWIVEMKTSMYEKLAYTHHIDNGKVGTYRLDLIGQESGQFIAIDEETRFSVGFNGFHWIKDI